MTEANKIFVPAITKAASANTEDVVIEIPYREAVGCIIYLMTITRSDVAFAVSIAVQKLNKSTKTGYQLNGFLNIYDAPLDLVCY